MEKTKIMELGDLKQSIWLDYISRDLIESGRLDELIALGIKGITSNPTIFNKAVNSGREYDETIRRLSGEGRNAFDVYDDLTVHDIQEAARKFKRVYDNTNGLDGYVSLEVDPRLAFDTKDTVKEARRLKEKVNCPNVMFKIPATAEGIKAIEDLTALGMNINATLIFSWKQYNDTALSYIKGLQRLAENEKDPKKVHSVASVFVSRIDTIVDVALNKMILESDPANKEKLIFLLGRAAVANCSLIYQKYLDIFSSRSFKMLASKGANAQRVLWASTSTKNPDYSDTKYISALIAENTVNTVPENTIKAFLDHGKIERPMDGDTKRSRETIEHLNKVGIDVNSVCGKLLKDGVLSFIKSFKSLLDTIEKKKNEVCKTIR